MNEWNNRITIAAILLMGVFIVGSQLPKQERNLAQAASSAVQPVAPTLNPGFPRLLKFNLSLSSPKDLKVRQGDRVGVGEVLADRIEDRSRLMSQRRTLEMAIEQISSRVIPNPPLPTIPPAVKSLPPISYAEEQAAIASAAMDVQLAQRAYALQQSILKAEPLEESSAAAMAAVKVENQQRLLDNQQRKLDAVQQLKDLPPEVVVHEQEILKQRSVQLQQVQAEYQQASAKLSAATNARNEKLTTLATALQQARASHQLAIAKLQTRKDTRAYAEYEASVTAARRAEEKNQAQQSYYRQLQEAQQQERDRSFQLAQINAKVAEVDDQLRTLSVVTSPYSGTVRRVKVLQQTDNNLSVELTLVVGDERERSTTAATTTTTTTTSYPSTFNPKPFTSSPSR